MSSSRISSSKRSSNSVKKRPSSVSLNGEDSKFDLASAAMESVTSNGAARSGPRLSSSIQQLIPAAANGATTAAVGPLAAQPKTGVLQGPNARNVPAFLNKLYTMVDSSATDDYIRWNDTGNAFLVLDPEEFAHHILPKYFKHNNFASFQRQLNMYGFHKVPHLHQGVLEPTAETEVVEFAHENFKRGQPDLLMFVVRKKGNRVEDEKEEVDLSSLLNEIATIKKHQLSISHQLKSIQNENHALWTETVNIRERYQQQQQTIDKILKFLASVFSKNKRLGPADDTTTSGSSSQITLVPRKKRRLLIDSGDVANTHSENDIEEIVDDKDSEVDVPEDDNVNDAHIETDLYPSASVASAAPEPVATSMLSLMDPQACDTNATPIPSPIDPLVQGVAQSGQRTTALADDIDLLQDNLDAITSSLGFDSSSFVGGGNSWDWNTLGNLSLNMKGSDRERATLLSLMNPMSLNSSVSVPTAIPTIPVNSTTLPLSTTALPQTSIGSTMPYDTTMTSKPTLQLSTWVPPIVPPTMMNENFVTASPAAATTSMQNDGFDLEDLLTEQFLSNGVHQPTGNGATGNGDFQDLLQ